MINVFTLTNLNTKIIEGKLSKIYISEVCIKLVALRINRYTRNDIYSFHIHFCLHKVRALTRLEAQTNVPLNQQKCDSAS